MIFSFEQVRLLTFKFWKNPNIDYMEIARAGFIYCNFRDRTRCFSCGLTIKQSEKKNIPEVLHVRLSNTCNWRNLNIPVYTNPLTSDEAGRDEVDTQSSDRSTRSSELSVQSEHSTQSASVQSEHSTWKIRTWTEPNRNMIRTWMERKLTRTNEN